MSECRICGDRQTAMFRAKKRQTLCAACDATTPIKVPRYHFDRVYWRGDPDVGERTKIEFYSDYLASTCTLAEYIDQTVFAVV